MTKTFFDSYIYIFRKRTINWCHNRKILIEDILEKYLINIENKCPFINIIMIKYNKI